MAGSKRCWNCGLLEAPGDSHRQETTEEGRQVLRCALGPTRHDWTTEPHTPTEDEWRDLGRPE